MTVTAPSKSLIFNFKINDFEDAKSMTRERGHVGWGATVEHVVFNDFHAKINDFES